MMRFTTGNILESEADILVNTVNTEGVMGKGIALAFKKSFPDNFKSYEAEVKAGRFDVGKVYLYKTQLTHPKYIVNFPTKKHWRYPSRMEWVRSGLVDLLARLKTIDDARSIALPPLGCGNGRLKWHDVKPVMTDMLGRLAGKWEVIIYEPGYKDQTMPDPAVKAKLTAARAILVHLLDRYRILGYEINLLVAHKLSYFMQRVGEPMRLSFDKGTYGPYAHALHHLLRTLNGSYLRFCDEDNKPTTSVTLIDKELAGVQTFIAAHATPEQKQRMDKVLDLIEDFESPYGLELLSTVDFMVQHTGRSDLETVQHEIHNWTDRKKEIMKPYHIQMALERLKHHFQYAN